MYSVCRKSLPTCQRDWILFGSFEEFVRGDVFQIDPLHTLFLPDLRRIGATDPNARSRVVNRFSPFHESFTILRELDVFLEQRRASVSANYDRHNCLCPHLYLVVDRGRHVLGMICSDPQVNETSTMFRFYCSRPYATNLP